MHKLATTLLFLFAGSLAAGSMASTGKPADPQQAQPLVSVPASDLKWRELPGTGGIKVADVRGSITGKGPYDAFVIFPAGKDNPY